MLSAPSGIRPGAAWEGMSSLPPGTDPMAFWGAQWGHCHGPGLARLSPSCLMPPRGLSPWLPGPSWVRLLSHLHGNQALEPPRHLVSLWGKGVLSQHPIFWCSHQTPTKSSGTIIGLACLTSNNETMARHSRRREHTDSRVTHMPGSRVGAKMNTPRDPVGSVDSRREQTDGAGTGVGLLRGHREVSNPLQDRGGSAVRLLAGLSGWRRPSPWEARSTVPSSNHEGDSIREPKAASKAQHTGKEKQRTEQKKLWNGL